MADLQIKQEMSLAEKKKILKKTTESLNKDFGKTLVGMIGDNPELEERLKVSWIPTPSLEFNEATGGGFPRRRISMVVGMPDSGKTGILLETIGKSMKEDQSA